MNAKTHHASNPILIIACGVALGCYWAWNGFFLSEGAQTVQRTLNTVAHGLTLLAFFLSKPGFKALRHRWLFVAVPLVMGGASALSLAGPGIVEPGLAEGLRSLLSVVLGSSSALLFVLWVEAFARFNLVREFENVTFLAVALSLALPSLREISPMVNGVAVVALPIISSLCIAAVLRAPASDIATVRGRRTSRSWPMVVPPWLMVCALVISTPLGYFKAGFSGSWHAMTLVSIVIGVTGIGLAMVLRARHKSEQLPRTLVLVISAGLLIMPLYDEHMVVGGAFVFAGSALFRAYIYQTCALVCLKSNTAPLKAFALITCIIDGGWVLGMVGRWLLDYAPPVVYTYTTVGIVYTLVVVILVFFTRQHDPLDLSRTPEHAAETPEGADETPSPLFKASQRLAARYSLTEREREIALLVVEGRTLSSIAEGLTVSRNTVKTHAHHAYAKCGVHGRDELTRLFHDYVDEE